MVVRFQVATPVGSDYYNKLQAAAQANTLPDIIGIAAGGEFLARYINAGKIFELTEPMSQDWENQFFPKALDDVSYRVGNQFGVKPNTVWAVPISAMSIQIFYNKDLFQKAGLDPENPPHTWSAFLEAGKKLRKQNVIPLSIGFGDLWMIGAFLEPYAWSYLGEKKIIETILGKHPYTSPEWEKVLRLFVDLKDYKILDKSSITSPNKESEQLFSSGRSAMTMNGSWGVSVFKGMNPKLNYGVMKLPKPDDAPFPMYVRGGVGSAAAVTTSSSYKKEAIEFLQWLSAKEQQILYANKGLDLPANQNCSKELIPQLQMFAANMNNLIPNTQLDEKFEVKETLWKGVQSIFVGEAKPKEILEKVQAAKIKSMRGI